MLRAPVDSACGVMGCTLQWGHTGLHNFSLLGKRTRGAERMEAPSALPMPRCVVVEERPSTPFAPAADEWVACDRCDKWRVVPAEMHAFFNFNEDAEFFCHYLNAALKSARCAGGSTRVWRAGGGG